MSNIYIWFKSETDRKAFTQRLIEYKHAAIKEDNLKKKIDINSDEMLKLMEAGKTKSPYFNLYKQFSRSESSEINEIFSPYHPSEVFKNGFRSIYYMNSYEHRPGKWLVVQLRDTNNARNILNFITETIPEERIGLNVPLSEKYTSAQKLKKLIELIDYIETNTAQKKGTDKNKEGDILNTIYKYLVEISDTTPESFDGENVSLWSRSALIFYYENDMDKMEICFKNQAKFQPGSSDAYLNMGILYHQNGNIDKALEAYKEGLKINPKDEDINFNISFLLSKIGNTKAALNYAKNALMINQSKAVNYVLIADIYFKDNDFQNALTYYTGALQKMDNASDPAIIAGCREKIMTCYLELVLKKEGKMNI